MSSDLPSALWRRKLTVLFTVVLVTAGTYFVARSLPDVYSAKATLFVGDRGERSNDFEALQSAQVLAKTYAELIQSKAVAARVAQATPQQDDADELLDKAEFEPVSDTQLIVISAEGDTPQQAAEVANTYASVFVEDAASRLAARTQSELTVADQATLPSSPTRPRPKLYSAVAFLLALFLGAGLALLRDRLSTRLGSDEEISEELDLPVLARMPVVGPRRGNAAREERFLENFRVLRTNLRFLRPGRPMTRYLVTSAGATEGKSTSSMALARVFAEQGDRVIVIEADLRRPTLLALFEMEQRPQRGLVQYLVLDSTLEDVLHDTSMPNVQIVPAGAVPPNPSVLLQTDGLRRLVNEAAEFADMVIIDSPPLSAGADASILGNAVEAVLFLVNYRRTRRARALAAVRQLRQAGADIAGLIVNEVPRTEHYDEYYYGQGHTDGAKRAPAATGSPR